MFLAMPAAVRIWAGVDSDAPCPITVREGRDFLSGWRDEHPLCPLPPVPVQLGAQGTVQPRVAPAEGLLLAEKSRLQGLEQTVTLPESAAAPGRQGDILGTLTVTQNGETLLEVPIRAAESVEKLSFGERFLRLARTMCFCG